MKPTLSILILTIPSRQASYWKLVTELRSQILIYAPAVGIIPNPAPADSIGAKRNWLLSKVESEYLCFLDDDDWPSENYIDLLMKAADSGCDCASLKGLLTWDGKNPEVFEHSIKYKKYETVDGPIKYLRFPNHLNMIKSKIAKQFKFPETNHGEDTDWATQIHNSGLLKKEFYIPEVIYYYRYITNKAAHV